MKASKHTLMAVAALEAHYGRRFLFEERHLPFWEQALGRLDPQVVERAVAAVVQHHTHGAPGLAEIKQAIAGRWETRKVTRTDAHGCAAPHLGQETLSCLVEYGSGRVLRAFNQRGDMVELGTLRVLEPAANVAAELGPPTTEPQTLAPPSNG